MFSMSKSRGLCEMQTLHLFRSIRHFGEDVKIYLVEIAVLA